MPGHSLHFNANLGRWTVFHGPSFEGTEFNLQDLYVRFQILGSKNAPRYFRCGGTGNDLELKYIALLEAGILEALQRWHPENPSAKPGTLHLAPAPSNRGPRGRKNDFADAERLVKRLVANELILSLVPEPEQRCGAPSCAPSIR